MSTIPDKEILARRWAADVTLPGWRNGCDEDSVVMRQVVGALLAPDASEDAKEIEIYLLYPVVAGSKGVYVVVDPMNEIVEGSESNNIMAVSEPLESPSPFFDVAGQVENTIDETEIPEIDFLKLEE